MEINILVEKCIKSAIDYCVAAFEIVENSRRTNRLYDKNFKNFRTLKSFGDNGVVELEKLIEHPNDYVKYCSATYLLSVREEKAKEVLNRLVSNHQLGFAAETLISEWDEGNLKDYLK